MERNISDGRPNTKNIAARRVATVAASFNAATYSGVLPIVVFGVYVSSFPASFKPEDEGQADPDLDGPVVSHRRCKLRLESGGFSDRVENLGTRDPADFLDLAVFADECRDKHLAGDVGFLGSSRILGIYFFSDRGCLINLPQLDDLFPRLLFQLRLFLSLLFQLRLLATLLL